MEKTRQLREIFGDIEGYEGYSPDYFLSKVQEVGTVQEIRRKIRKLKEENPNWVQAIQEVHPQFVVNTEQTTNRKEKANISLGFVGREKQPVIQLTQYRHVSPPRGRRVC